MHLQRPPFPTPTYLGHLAWNRRMIVIHHSVHGDVGAQAPVWSLEMEG